MTQEAAAVSVHSRDARYAQDIHVGHHVLVVDEPVASGGADAGPAPFSLLLAALGACTSITLRMYSEKKGWDLGRVSVSLRMSKEADGERIDRRIRFGKAPSEEQKSRLLEIAQKTPLTKTILRGTAIVTSVELGGDGAA